MSAGWSAACARTLRDDARATAVDELERIRAAVDVPRVDLQLDPEDLPDDALRADVVVRTVQEAVTNAVRHAQASTVSVVIRRTGDAAASPAQPSRIRTLVRVSDDGLGVDELVAGNGLRGMAERLDAAGGTLRIHTRVGAGVRIQAEVPWADHSAPGAKRPADQRVVDAAAAP
jgi:signal transduction histidine kinase